MNSLPETEVTVIYDGNCELCKSSVSWVQKRLHITALDFHTVELSKFGLSKEQCAREVFVITEYARYHGAQAVAYLLQRRGNTFLSRIFFASGKFGEFGYRWVAIHRRSFPVKALAVLLERAAR